jgi:fructokinase
MQQRTAMVKSIPVKPVDTTGAGDAFVGATLYQLSAMDSFSFEGLSFGDWEKIISNANRAGARTCEYLGAMEAFKHLSNDIFS